MTGGLPGRMGELRFGTSLREAGLSIPVSYDTLYGISWSPDGQLVAVGVRTTLFGPFVWKMVSKCSFRAHTMIG